MQYHDPGDPHIGRDSFRIGDGLSSDMADCIRDDRVSVGAIAAVLAPIGRASGTPEPQAWR
jgi:hypothetical protein